jgi:hypothetical protein
VLEIVEFIVQELTFSVPVLEIRDLSLMVKRLAIRGSNLK